MNLITIELQSFGKYTTFFNETDHKILVLEVEEAEKDFETFKKELDAQVREFFIKAYKKNGASTNIHTDGNIRFFNKKFTLSRVVYHMDFLEVRPYNKVEDCFPENKKYDVEGKNIVEIMDMIYENLIGDITEILENHK